VKRVLAILIFLTASASIAQEVAISSDRMLSQQGVTEFTGSVVLTSENVTLEADTLRINQDAQQYVTTGQPVRLRISQREVPTALTAEKLEYDQIQRSVAMTGQVNIVHGDISLSSFSAHYDIDADRVRATDSVAIDAANYSGTGATLDIAGLSEKLKLIMNGTKAQPARLRIITAEQK